MESLLNVDETSVYPVEPEIDVSRLDNTEWSLLAIKSMSLNWNRASYKLALCPQLLNVCFSGINPTEH